MVENSNPQVPDTAPIWLLRANYLLLLIGCALNAAPILALLIARNQMPGNHDPLLDAHWRWQRNSAALFITMRGFSFVLLWLEPGDGALYGVTLGLIGETIWLMYRTLKGTYYLCQGNEPARPGSL